MTGIENGGHVQDLRDWLRLKCKQKGRESFPEVVIARQPDEIKEEILDEADREDDNEGEDWVDSDGDDETGGVNELQSDSDPEFMFSEYPATSEEVTSRKSKRKREVELVETEDFEDGEEVECGSFQCCFCWMSFKNPSSFKSHVGLNHARGKAKETFQKGAFKCEEDGCQQRFQSHLELNSHLTTHSLEIHFCPACDWGFIGENLLKLHQLIHIRPVKNRDSPYHWRTCPEADCKMDFDTITKLQDHFNVKHGAQLKRFKCLECGQTATSEKALSYHERVFHHGLVRKGRPVPETTEEKVVAETEDECESESLQCCFCWMSFETPSSLKSHVGLVHVHARGAKETFQKGAFQCEKDDCQLRFHSRLKLNSHLATHSQPVHFCPVCEWGFIDANLLKLHELVHIKPFKDGKTAFLWRTCPEPDCKTNCSTITKLQDHYNMKHGAQLKRFKCLECGQAASSERALAAHERVVHLGQVKKNRPPPKTKQASKSTLIPCEVEGCPEQFSRHLELNSHLQTHSETINYCKNCGFGFIDVNLLKLHELAHIKPSVKRGEKKLRICPEPGCSYGTHTIAGLQRHYNIKHGVSLKRFKCSECDHHSTSESALRTHVKFMHGSIKRVAYNQKDGQKKCVDCGLEFETGWQLLGHRSSHHVRTLCPICKDAFFGREELQKHINIAHSQNEWKFKCGTCSKTFPTAERLRFHKNNSHSEKQWECVECKKVFRTSSSFYEHRKAIHDPEVSICPQCGKTFPSFAYMKSHMSKRHKNTEENLECAVCGFKMKKHEMKKHMLTHLSMEERRAAGSVHMCHLCEKEFLTKDAYNKHIATHENGNNSMEASGYQEADASEKLFGN